MFVAVAAVAFGSSFAAFNPTSTIQSDNVDGAFVKGHVDVVQRNELGEIVAYRQSDNSITNDGMQLLAERLITVTNSTATDAALTHVDVGTGGETAADSTQTALTTPIVAGDGCGRAVLTAINDEDTDASANLTITVSAQIDAGADADCAQSSIDEAGIFNASTGGDMFARNTFTAVTLAGTDTLDITWTFDFSDT